MAPQIHSFFKFIAFCLFVLMVITSCAKDSDLFLEVIQEQIEEEVQSEENSVDEEELTELNDHFKAPTTRDFEKLKKKNSDSNFLFFCQNMNFHQNKKNAFCISPPKKTVVRPHKKSLTDDTFDDDEIPSRFRTQSGSGVTTTFIANYRL